MKYAEVPHFSDDEINQIISWNDLSRLHLVSLSLSLYHADMHWAIGRCINLARHSDATVRGNALLSFGHFARRFRAAHRNLVEPLIQLGLRDKDSYVQSHAEAAANDIDAFCTWKVDRNSKKRNLI